MRLGLLLMVLGCRTTGGDYIGDTRHFDTTYATTDSDSDTDTDCVGSDEGPWYPDADEDGFGDASASSRDCDPGGWVNVAGDCRDSDPFIHPEAPDRSCDGIDDNCNDVIDDEYRADYRLISMQPSGAIIDISRNNGSTLAFIDSNPSFPASSTTLAEDDVGFGYIRFPTPRVGTFDACTGDTTTIGPTGQDLTGAMSFGPSMELYAINGGAGALVEIDLATGNATTIGNLGVQLDNAGLTYDCSTDTMYAIDSAAATLYTIDYLTGSASNPIVLGLAFNAVGLAFDHQSRQLLVATGTELYSVDPATGTDTLIGATDPDVNDLAFFPECQN